MIITIDGPAGSGKSSLAKALARKLKIPHLNTGLLYRAASLLLMAKPGLDLEACLESPLQIDEKAIEKLDAIEMRLANNEFRLWIDQEDFTTILSKQIFDKTSAMVSPNPLVRQAILKIQRKLGQTGSLVIDGRDCGSVVFPEADLKLFLTANPKARALRIANRNKAQDQQSLDLEKLEKEIIERDRKDTTREHSPLIVPENAFLIDNSEMDKQETLAFVLKLVKIELF